MPKDAIAQLRRELSDLHRAVGSPTLTTLESCASRVGVHLAPSTASDLLKGPRLPKLATVEAFVLACREHHRADRKSSGVEQLPPELFDIARWRSRYESETALHSPRTGQSTSEFEKLGHDRYKGTGRSASIVFLEYARDRAPSQLIDRFSELAELAQFCRGEEPYIWWQAPPWAGKSSLVASFVLNPPENVDIVSFFISSRLRDRDNSVAFSNAMIEQLAALVGEDFHVPRPGERDAYFHSLTRIAAQRAALAGRRLVFVVDGLDEDCSRENPRGRNCPALPLCSQENR